MTPKAICLKLRELITSMPNLAQDHSAMNVQIWLGDIEALVKKSGEVMELRNLMAERKSLEIFTPADIFWDSRKKAYFNIRAILIRVQSVMQLKANEEIQAEERAAKVKAPDVSQESFIGAGKGFDAFTAIAKVFGKATKEILIVDPYLDEKIFTDFMLAIPEHIPAKLLASNKNTKRGILQPAFNRWAGQHGGTRPTELRVASHNDLHDRLVIVDNTKVWILSQSFNSFAERAPASIMLSQTPEEKIEFYKNMWNNAEPI